MSSTVSLYSAVFLCQIVKPATLNDRSLAALEARITIDKRVSEREFMRRNATQYIERTLMHASVQNGRIIAFGIRIFGG